MYTSYFGKDKWHSIGPRILDDGSSGRMNAIAFDPKNPLTTMYAGGVGNDGGIPAGAGVWKTTNGGNSWFPVGDKLSSMMIGSVAVDPKDSNVVYAGGTYGIFKSTDGGDGWYDFANSKIAQHVKKIVVRYTDSGQVMIYAQCNRGVLRYKGNPYATFSNFLDWDVVKKGNISDLIVTTNSSILYAGVVGDGIYRTDFGEFAGDNDWTKLTTGLPTITGDMWVTLDIHKLYGLLYAGITKPEAGIDFAIYRGTDGGNSWTPIKKYAAGDLADRFYADPIYNPYIRVVPKAATYTFLPEVIYFGGADLYQLINYKPLTLPAVVPQGGTFMVSGYEVEQRAGADVKALEFEPDPFWQEYVYMSLGDQGVYRCAISTTPRQWTLPNKKYGEAGDVCINRNYDLRVTEFYDFDVSKTNPDFILGGTQDTGTIRYNGDPTWNVIPTGDGLYSLIDPNSDNIMYLQDQSLNSTRRSQDGGGKWQGISGLPVNSGPDLAYITTDPKAPDGVITLGKDGNGLLYVEGGKITTGFNFWPGQLLTRVIVHPTTFTWIIGTDKGKIFFFDKDTLEKRPVFSHPLGYRVASLSVSAKDPNRLYATFISNCPSCPSDKRIYYVDIDASNWQTSWSSAQSHDISSNFPADLTPRVIVGDPYDSDIAYVGTEKGVWRWNTAAGYGNIPWHSYNDGLPLTTVVKLLIAPDKSLLAATKGRGAWRVFFVVGP